MRSHSTRVNEQNTSPGPTRYPATYTRPQHPVSYVRPLKALSFNVHIAFENLFP
jgi:hypothetical protein